MLGQQKVEEVQEIARRRKQGNISGIYSEYKK